MIPTAVIWRPSTFEGREVTFLIRMKAGRRGNGIARHSQAPSRRGRREAPPESRRSKTSSDLRPGARSVARKGSPQGLGTAPMPYAGLRLGQFRVRGGEWEECWSTE